MRTYRVLPVTVAVVLASIGCTRVIDDPQPVRAWPVAPITAGQISDVLSPKAKPENESNLFHTVEPSQCAGIASEVDPPFLFDIGVTPAARSAGQWFADDQRPQYSIQEMVVVYPANFDPQAALRDVRRTIDTCREQSLTVITTERDTLHFEPLPPQESGAPEIALWSLSGGQRSCDNAYIAAYNAAIEVTACGDRNGYDVLGLAEQALDRLHALANMTS